ncbi:MAG: 1-(5-phosphoribosyl)-5-[(5-phosphoribosylamino)methylideneamino]imidazole-4-carboxamide isomerase [Pelagibacteraceae bacterium]|nr:MAG: 1-(5-phosphoribosyl)-5-[(5-phosphoribosylamino)methylideneamino]imidazole-4-carboxamide isomerase [Pelagibacteraceae bacterium]
MIIFPAIDLKDGECVRLYKGDFNKMTIFNSSPFNQALEFQKKGFTNLHLVDLDGALKGRSKNKKVIIKIIKNTHLNVQLGGGIRTLKQISFWIKNGVSTVVVGTMAIQNIKILKKACNLFPGQIAVALDVRNNFLAMKGWAKQTKIKLMEFSKKLEGFGVSKIIYTDINRDGTKKGVNFFQLKKIINKINIPLVVSGGVSSIKDIQKLRKLGLFDGVIIGKAIYDKSISLSELRKFV